MSPCVSAADGVLSYVKHSGITWLPWAQVTAVVQSFDCAVF